MLHWSNKHQCWIRLFSRNSVSKYMWWSASSGKVFSSSQKMRRSLFMYRWLSVKIRQTKVFIFYCFYENVLCQRKVLNVINCLSVVNTNICVPSLSCQTYRFAEYMDAFFMKPYDYWTWCLDRKRFISCRSDIDSALALVSMVVCTLTVTFTKQAVLVIDGVFRAQYKRTMTAMDADIKKTFQTQLKLMEDLIHRIGRLSITSSNPEIPSDPQFRSISDFLHDPQLGVTFESWFERYEDMFTVDLAD